MSRFETDPGQLEAFYRETGERHLVPLWTVTAKLLPFEPQTKVLPYLWRWSELRRLAYRAAELVPIERGGERRVLAFVNPGLGGKYAATHTLWGAVQIVLPGEVAPCHRHTASAIRFIIEGERCFTNVNGDKCVMSRGDLVLTPNWTWHDHGSEANEAMIWMDGLDLPLVGDLDAIFFELYPGLQQPVVQVNGSERSFGGPHLMPTWEKPQEAYSPLLNFKWAPTYEALKRVGEAPASPFDDVCFEYRNPNTGGPTLPTMSCIVQMIRPGVHTQAHRQVNSAVYHVFEGTGYTVINGRRFDWERGDFFVVPPWAWHEHANESKEEAILFSVQDTPVMQALGLYREEPYPENGGRQKITDVFKP
ncbi:MAG TPA: cupin domain-containing protein [candidate division Zixibacteria bacterium]|nr:cupin domain-containing protein [candidate division Zixibacteria bacterium]